MPEEVDEDLEVWDLWSAPCESRSDITARRHNDLLGIFPWAVMSGLGIATAQRSLTVR
jgi:hypothetical protein